MVGEVLGPVVSEPGASRKVVGTCYDSQFSELLSCAGLAVTSATLRCKNRSMLHNQQLLMHVSVIHAVLRPPTPHCQQQLSPCTITIMSAPKAISEQLVNELCLAAAAGDQAAVQDALDQGVHVDALATKHGPFLGRTALEAAAFHGHTAVIDQLVARGANVDLVTHTHADIGQPVATSADTDLVTYGECSALMWAAFAGQTAVVQQLIAMGATVDNPAGKQLTPLMWAAGQGHPAVVKQLIAAGAAVNHAIFVGWTALHCAALTGNLEVTKLLLAAGADASATTNMGMTPLQFAATSRTGQLQPVAIVRSLLAHATIPVPMLIQAASSAVEDTSIMNTSHTQVFDIIVRHIAERDRDAAVELAKRVRRPDRDRIFTAYKQGMLSGMAVYEDTAEQQRAAIEQDRQQIDQQWQRVQQLIIRIAAMQQSQSTAAECDKQDPWAF